MQTIRLILFSLFAFCAAATNAETTDCFNADETPVIKVQGTIRKVNFTHPNGNPLVAWMFKLDTPICYTFAGQAVQENDMQILNYDKRVTLTDGARVIITGKLRTNPPTAYYLSSTSIMIGELP